VSPNIFDAFQRRARVGKAPDEHGRYPRLFGRRFIWQKIHKPRVSEDVNYSRKNGRVFFRGRSIEFFFKTKEFFSASLSPDSARRITL
jgi:hypothetical protein